MELPGTQVSQFSSYSTQGAARPGYFTGIEACFTGGETRTDGENLTRWYIFFFNGDDMRHCRSYAEKYWRIISVLAWFLGWHRATKSAYFFLKSQ